MNPDFSKRLDEIAKELGAYVGEAHLTKIEAALLKAIEEFAKLEPSEEVIREVCLTRPFGIKQIYRTMCAAQWKEIQEGK
jgi:hypothetical protein